jgi:hypothetical protein
MITRDDLKAPPCPDADQTLSLGGVGWNRYAIDWRFLERTYTTHIWATDLADAERRLVALKAGAVVVGQVFVERTA